MALEEFRNSKEGSVVNVERVEEALRKIKQEASEAPDKMKMPALEELVPIKRTREKTTKENKADPEWLKLIRACIETLKSIVELRCKIFGLYQDLNVNVTQNNSQLALFNEIVAELEKPRVDVEDLINEGIPMKDMEAAPVSEEGHLIEFPVQAR